MSLESRTAFVPPMLADTGQAPIDSPAYAYEPKYDGIRAIVSIEPDITIWSRLGNDKTAEFPDLVGVLRDWAGPVTSPLVLDGEIVALDTHDAPASFQTLQGRQQRKTRVGFIAFDLLRASGVDYTGKPFRQRRQALEQLFNTNNDARLRLSEHIVGDGRILRERALHEGWEGVVAKRLDSTYRSGRRSPDWQKLKFVRTQTCVVGGWTEPRGSRPFFGALLLGLFDRLGRLEYVGHSGAGFTDAELGRVWKRLRALNATACPFSKVSRTNERPHWTKPRLVVEVKFTEWTADERLRHPTYLGMRDDIAPSDVRREPDESVRVAAHEVSEAAERKTRPRTKTSPRSAPSSESKKTTRRVQPKARDRVAVPSAEETHALISALDALEEGNGNGTLHLPDGDRLEVTNLRKVFWPGLKLTKGDLFRHYVRVASVILPVLEGRPLVMKRYPNGVSGKPFYQHRAPESLPSGVRIETAATGVERRTHLIGGGLKTLLYTAQLASISQDPWFSRVGVEPFADHVAIDLDPPDDLPFGRVLDVAKWVHDELDALGAPGFPKTSGSRGLHIYIPMPPDTPYEAGLLFCQIVTTMVAKKHSKQATLERSVAARGRRIYLDFLQNILGKTLASAYSPRANDFAGVSTPLTWKEVEAGVSPKDFTLRTFAARLEEVGDLWKPLRTSKGADLRSVMKYAEP